MQLNPVALQPRWGGNAAGGPRVTLRHSYKNLHCGVSSSLLWNTRRRNIHYLDSIWTSFGSKVSGLTTGVMMLHT